MTSEEIYTAAIMWREGASSKEIADALFVFESEIYNQIDKIKAVEIVEAV